MKKLRLVSGKKQKELQFPANIMIVANYSQQEF